MTSAGAAVLVAALVGCGSDDESDDPGGPGAGSAERVNGSPLVSTQELADLGTVLVDGSGRTLYFADEETDGTIRCVNACLEFWKPAEATGALSSDISKLDAVRRDDTGVRQLTYDGAPLYTFTLDKGPGQVTGDDLTDSFAGVEFTWHAAVTDQADTTEDDTDDGSSPYDYGY